MSIRIFATRATQDRKHGGDYKWKFNNDNLELRDLFALAITQGLASHYGLTGRQDHRTEKIWELADELVASR